MTSWPVVLEKGGVVLVDILRPTLYVLSSAFYILWPFFYLLMAIIGSGLANPSGEASDGSDSFTYLQASRRHLFTVDPTSWLLTGLTGFISAGIPVVVCVQLIQESSSRDPN